MSSSNASIKRAEVERLATGFEFTEGPVWNAREGCLLFSDIPANKIMRWTPGKDVETFRSHSGNSNGLTYDREGRLVACEHGERRVSLAEKNNAVTVLASHYKGKRLNSPNDVVVKSDGTIYFTDPPYGIEPKDQELSYQGVYCISPDTSELTLLSKDFDKPNGLAFSPDEKLLYIGDSSERKHIRIFNVEEDGSITGGRVFAQIRSEEPGAPDGMKVDTEGRLYVAAPGGIWVFSPSAGLQSIIRVPETPANCAWGGHDCRSLYITARTSLYRIMLQAQGRVP
ncbi:SMP-30/gluconolactonase/LRE family protein [Candidatus Bathyarchaeota archaeon]|nr:SMP-30/gluconolactonase/LRE family protein [Candidatus Bathyarchaeota archaeon]